MSWRGRLDLQYTRSGDRTVALDRHDGPLRVLQRLYPEGPEVCHHVLVHPPGGIAGGDELQIHAALAADAHALITTPGATRFYRSDSAQAIQHVRLELDAGARLEWLPMETIAHSGCLAQNRLQMMLAAGAQLIGWDLLALGLPAANEPFERGEFHQCIEWPGHWLENARLRAGDRSLLDSPAGWAGHRTLATLWFASGSPLDETLREGLLAAAREPDAGNDIGESGASSPHAHLVVLRVLAPRVEPAMARLVAVRAAWRRLAWSLDANPPRIWNT